jgi:imidazolonepropionase-like amidohydrolase
MVCKRRHNFVKFQEEDIMKNLWNMLVVVGLIFCSPFIVPSVSGAESAPLVLINGTLIDGTGAEPVPDAVVVIQQDRILAVGCADQVNIPANAQRLDVKGMTILPGFINAHVHLGYDEQKLQAWAQGGVTTVRDLGAFTMDGQWFTRRNALNKDSRNARLVSAGPFITVPEGYPIVPWGGSGIIVTSPEEAAQKTEQLLQQGADLIKTTLETGKIFGREIAVPSPEEAAVIVRVAHQRGTVVSAHITHSSDVERLLASGVDDIAHMVVDNLSDALVAKVIEKGTYWAPTLELWHGVGHGFGPIAINNLRRFVQAGGKVALGTDYAGYSSQFDLGMPIREIEWMQAAGMTPMQIIVAATKNAAHVCNQEQTLGTLEPGKIADILVVKGNPLDDLQTFLNVSLVIHNGVIIRPEETASETYRGGVYEVQDAPDVEGYFCKAKVTIANQKIMGVEWNIFDRNRSNRIFDETYEEVYAGNKLYQQQCQDDLKGTKTYGPKLVETQDLHKVDAVTGATWAHKKFVNIMKSALEKAKQ